MDYESVLQQQLISSNMNISFSRDVLFCFQILKAMLEQSRYTYKGELSGGEKEALEGLVDYYGTARRVIYTNGKLLEQEMNLMFLCSKNSSCMNISNVECLLQDVVHAVDILYKKSCLRTSQSYDKVSGNIYDQLQSLILKLEENILMEYTKNKTELSSFEQDQKAKMEAKQNKATSFQKKDNFEGMSEAQIKKILAKRADKEKKAAAKQNSKKKTYGLGTGTSSFLAIEKSLGVDIPNILFYTHVQSTFLPNLLSGGTQRKPKLAKGTRDYFPHEMSLRQHVISTIRSIFLSHGGEEIDTPIFELRDTLTGKYGDEGTQLIYDLADQGGEALSLRYDLTVPFARFLAMYNIGTIKRFHIGKVYRRDQPVLSKGRYREFYQCDFDIAMSNFAPMVPDSECISIMSEILSSIDIGSFQIKVNHRVLLDAVLDLSNVSSDKFKTICSSIDKLDKEPWEAVKKEMVEVKGLTMEQADNIGGIVLQSNDNVWELYQYLLDSNTFGNHEGANKALADLKLLFTYLQSMGKLSYIKFDLSLARGLDYYTGVIYEAVSINPDSGIQVGSIGGGGRYDTLVSMFQDAGKLTPCVGVSIGIERVFTLLEERLKQKNQQGLYTRTIDVYIASASTSSILPPKMEIASMLWNAKIRCEFNPNLNPKLKYELQYVLEKDIPFMVIIGEDEWKEGKCKVKDIKERLEETVDVGDLVNVLKGKIGV